MKIHHRDRVTVKRGDRARVSGLQGVAQRCEVVLVVAVQVGDQGIAAGSPTPPARVPLPVPCERRGEVRALRQPLQGQVANGAQQPPAQGAAGGTPHLDQRLPGQRAAQRGHVSEPRTDHGGGAGQVEVAHEHPEPPKRHPLGGGEPLGTPQDGVAQGAMTLGPVVLPGREIE